MRVVKVDTWSIALQWRPENIVDNNLQHMVHKEGDEWKVATPEGYVTVNAGDWVVEDMHNYFYRREVFSDKEFKKNFVRLK